MDELFVSKNLVFGMNILLEGIQLHVMLGTNSTEENIKVVDA